MAESLPAPKAYYRIKGGADDSWNWAVGGEFQAVDGVEYDVCCVGPSAITTKQWWLPTVGIRLVSSDGKQLISSDGKLLTASVGT